MVDPGWYCPNCQTQGSDHDVVYCPHDGTCVRPLAERGRRWIGQVLDGKYRVVRFVDAGGTAEVYEAERLGSGKRVALKLLHAFLAADERALAAFRDEAKLVSLIAHPNIVGIEDFGTLPNGMHYMVMELLSGRSIGSALGSGPIDPRRALRYAMQACEGLAAAHERGVLHCDIKPDNLFLQDEQGEPEPKVKVLDLGIGKHFSRGARTESDTISGTPEYMSPEQIRGETLAPTSDLYAIGIVIYEMLFGAPPFSDPVPLRTLRQHLTELPVWPRDKASRLRIPEGVEAVVLRALSKRPEERQSSMLDLQRELGVLTRELRVPGASSAPVPATGARSVLPPRSSPLASRAAPTLTSAPNRADTRRDDPDGGRVADVEGLRARIAELEHVTAAHERRERASVVRQAGSQALIAASSLADAAPRIFEALRWSTSCEMGAIWQLDGDVLRACEIWSPSEASLRAFADATRALAFPRGVGLPGRVWATGRLTSIGDVTRDDNFPRAEAARAAGFHAAVAFPIVLDGAVIGVLDCFGRRMRVPEREHLDAAADLGKLLGLFMGRMRLEANREAKRQSPAVPILEIAEGVLLLPLMGSLDAARTAAMASWLRMELPQRQARFLLLDVTAAERLDARSADDLLEVVRAAEELGATCVLTGLRSSAAHGLARSGFRGAIAPTLAEGVGRCLGTGAGAGSRPARG